VLCHLSARAPARVWPLQCGASVPSRQHVRRRIRHRKSQCHRTWLNRIVDDLGTQTAAAISFAIMAAALHPADQARVQAELDTVIGRQRRKKRGVFCFLASNLTSDAPVPTFEDEDALPELRAFMMEVYRWRPVSIAGQ
jgi:hypothetical protein